MDWNRKRILGALGPEKMAEHSSNHLPGDLVEKIISMMPFPSIFKARMLSTSWLVRFSAITPHHSEEKKNLAARFQSLVMESCSNWDTFCLVCLDKNVSRAYDQSSHSWRRIISLSFLPQCFLTDSYMHLQGALLLMYKNVREEEMCVANILTQSWRVLPPRRKARETLLFSANIVSPTDSQTYKIVLFCVDCKRLDVCSAQIYDSRSNFWSRKILLLMEDFAVIRPAVYFDGALYMLGNLSRLFAFNVEEETWEELTRELDLSSFEGCNVDLVVCSGRLLMAQKEDTEPDEPTVYRLLQIDLRSLRISEVGRGPPADLELGPMKTQLVSHGDCVFFGVEESLGRVLAYDFREDRWSCLPLSFGDYYNPSSFQPGLNPFVTA